MALRLAIFAALTFLNRAAWADEAAALPVQLDFASDPGCSSQQEFERKINQRTPVLLGGATPALRLEVALTRDTSGVTGSLRAASLAGSDAREVTGPTCRDVADALALIASLMIERTQREQARAQLPPPAMPKPAPEPVRPPALAKDIPTPIRLGLHTSATWCTTDSPLAGAGLSLWLEKLLTWSLTASYGANRFVGEPERVGFGLGSITLAVGAPALTLGRLQLSGALAARAGFLAAEGVNVDVSYSVRRSYAAAGVAARGQLELVPRFFGFVELGALTPLTARRFSINEPERVVAETASIAPEIALGLALGL